MMMALIKKDLRVNAVPLIGNLLMILLADVLIIGSFLTSRVYPGQAAYARAQMLAVCGFLGVNITVVLGAVYGGIAFAHERAERSAEFLAMLPVPRRSIVVSKIIVALSCMLTIIATNFLIYLLAVLISPRSSEQLEPDFLTAYIGTAIMLFGMAWGSSALLKSSSISASIAIGSTFLLWMALISFVEFATERSMGDGERVLGGLLCAVSGGVAFAAGTAIYLRRVQP
jgi:ABC-type transport system involved in multi-copper enzyme maturation permease subunit